MTTNAHLPPVDPAQVGERIQSLLRSLPESLWHTTTPPTMFKIANNKACLVPSNYQPEAGDLVFVYENKDGFISIKKIYPDDSEFAV
jgi:hypothetical protein